MIIKSTLELKCTSRSWRDLFLDKNAPPIVAVEREIIGGGEEGDKVDEEEEEEEGESEEVDCEVRFVLDLQIKWELNHH